MSGIPADAYLKYLQGLKMAPVVAPTWVLFVFGKWLGSKSSEVTAQERLLNFPAYRVGTGLVVEFTPVGAPAVNILLRILSSLGVKNFFCVGTCGALAEDLPLGALVAPAKILHDGGSFSRLQIPEEQNLPLHFPGEPVCLLSTDDPFDRSADKTLFLQRCGVQVVDMEAALIGHCATLSGGVFGGLFVVSDLCRPDWKPGFTEVKEALAKAQSLAISQLIEDTHKLK